ncbi:hypothetical protein FRB94_004345 [Tulasnella sp. JGI-2019a]|nr:hypothetical protein FRB94_004345 [Tulasnella sp. JGI-2019a]
MDSTPDDQDVVFPKRRLRRTLHPVDPCPGMYMAKGQETTGIATSFSRASRENITDITFLDTQPAVRSRPTAMLSNTPASRSLVPAMSLRPPALPFLLNPPKILAINTRLPDPPTALQGDNAEVDLTILPPQITVEAFLKSTSAAKPKAQKKITYKRRRGEAFRTMLEGSSAALEAASLFDDEDDDIPLSVLAERRRKQKRPRPPHTRTQKRISGTRSSRHGDTSRTKPPDARTKSLHQDAVNAPPITPPLLEPVQGHVEKENAVTKVGKWKAMNNKRNPMFPTAFSAKPTPMLTPGADFKRPITQWMLNNFAQAVEKARLETPSCQSAGRKGTESAGALDDQRNTQPLVFVSLVQHEAELKDIRSTDLTNSESGPTKWGESPQSGPLKTKTNSIMGIALPPLPKLEFTEADISGCENPQQRVVLSPRNALDSVTALEFRPADFHNKPRSAKSVRFNSIDTNPRRFDILREAVQQPPNDCADSVTVAAVALPSPDAIVHMLESQTPLPASTVAPNFPSDDPHASNLLGATQPNASWPSLGDALTHLIDTHVPRSRPEALSRKRTRHHRDAL